MIDLCFGAPSAFLLASATHVARRGSRQKQEEGAASSLSRT